MNEARWRLDFVHDSRNLDNNNKITPLQNKWFAFVRLNESYFSHTKLRMFSYVPRFFFLSLCKQNNYLSRKTVY